MKAVVVASKERISIGSFGGRPRQRQAVEAGAAALLRHPLLAGAEVVDVAEGDVAHRRPARNGEGEREERDPALRVHRAVDRVDDDPGRAAGAECALAELLRDEEEVGLERLEPRHDRVLGGSVDRGRVVAALACPQHRLTLGPGRQRLQDAVDVRDAAAAESQPVDRGGHTGWKSRPLVSLGKKYVVFCGITSPRRARSNTSSMRVARSRKAPSNSPESTRAIASSRSAV